MKKFKAFTLAEVLITLSILGVVAAIMIPSTVKRISDKQTVAAVKKAYATLQSAIDIAIIENGEIQTWDWPYKTDTSSNQNNLNGPYLAATLSKYINISQNCYSSMQGECRKYYIKNLQGDTLENDYQTNNFYKNVLVLKNGMVLRCYTSNVINRNTPWAAITLQTDINGSKGPNRVGYDIFLFPFDDTGNIYNYNAGTCNAMKTYTVANGNNGIGCVNWIIKHNNMDYKYRDVTSDW